MGRQSVRWSVALLMVGAVAALAGVGVWQLSAVVWRWPRADVIALAGAVVLAVIALGIAPAQGWVSGGVSDRTRHGVVITRARAGRHIVAKGVGAVRIDRSSAAGDIRASQRARPLDARVEGDGGGDGGPTS